MSNEIKKNGRPFKEFNVETFEALCEIQCTRDEICAVLHCTDKTLDRWCKRTYHDDEGNPMPFKEVYAIKRQGGFASLRRKQWNLAEKNAAMAIFLGKNYLGQTDQPQPHQIEIVDDPLSASLKKIAKEL